MFGLDAYLTGLSDGVSLVVILGVAILLGLRHATDPDHLVAVTTLFASGRERTRRAAGALGLSWGLGHATSLFAFGLPVVVFHAYLPERVQQGAEVMIGLVIVALAAWLLMRWRSGLFHVHVHDHDEAFHAHVHAHAEQPQPPHPHDAAPRVRTRLQAYGIGLVHGLGGSAGVGVLLLAMIHDRAIAVAAMALFAVFTALSMAVASLGFGVTLSSARVSRSFHRLVPVISCASLAFGAWYALGALELAPYYF